MTSPEQSNQRVSCLPKWPHQLVCVRLKQTHRNTNVKSPACLMSILLFWQAAVRTAHVIMWSFRANGLSFMWAGAFHLCIPNAADPRSSITAPLQEHVLPLGKWKIEQKRNKTEVKLDIQMHSWDERIYKVETSKITLQTQFSVRATH